MGLDVFAFWGEKFDDWECLCSDECLIASLSIKASREGGGMRGKERY